MKKKYVISILVMLVFITGCGSNAYSKLTKEVDSIFKNQPVLTEAEIGIGDASVTFSVYESVANEQFYIQFGDAELYTDGESIWFNDSTGNFIADYTDELKDIVDVNDDLKLNVEADLQLPHGLNKVDREFLLEYFINPSYYSYNNELLRNVVHEKDNGFYTIQGQEDTIEFGLDGETFFVNEIGKHAYSTETNKVVTDYTFPVTDPIEISDTELSSKVDASVTRNSKQYEADIEKYFDENPKAIEEMMKENKLATVKLLGGELLANNE